MSEYFFDRDAFIAQLEADKAYVQDFYSVRNSEFERMEKWYFKDHYDNMAEVGAPDHVMDEPVEDAEHLTILTTATNVINSVHGMLTDEDFYIQAISGSTKKSREAATKVERYCHGTYWINRQVSGSDPWEDAAQDMLLYGWGAVYSYWDSDRADISRAKGTGRSKDVLDLYAYPVVVKRVHPGDLYPLPFGVRERWRGMLWIVNRTVREIEDEWNCILQGDEALDEDGNVMYDEFGEPIRDFLAPDSSVEYVDYWVWRKDDGEGGEDWTLWHCVMAAGQVVKEPTPMYEYEMLPYEIFFCRKTPSSSGSRMGLSFLYPLIEPIQELEYLANRMSRAIELYADPMLLIKGGMQGDDFDLEKGPGTTIQVEEGGDAHYVTWSGSPPDVGHLLGLWRDSAQDAFPPVMTGLAGGTSGLDTIALQQGGKLQTNKPRRNLELAIQRVNTKIIRLLQRFARDESVYVVGVRTEGDNQTPFDFSLKGRDTRGFENTLAQVRGRFPNEELRNVVLAAQAVGAGLMSAREAMGKYMYTQDPDNSFRLLMQELFIKDPQWRQFFFSQYQALPARSDVSAILQGEDEDEELAIPGPDLTATDEAGGELAAALAEDIGGVQRGVQQTAGLSNLISGMSGGVGVEEVG